jgi:hypothetical protein
MRHWMKIAVAMVVALSLSNDALAKKPKKDKNAPTDTTEQPADGKAPEAAATLEIQTTGIADVDNVFQQAVDPLNNLRNARNSLNSLNTNLATVLGLPAGTPIADALNDLKAKAEGKITMAIDEKGLPKLTPGDAVPQNVTDAINAVNQGVSDVMTAVENLAQLPSQMKEVAAAATAISPDSLISSGVKPLEAPKLMKTVNSNIKLLGEAPNELVELKASLESTIGTLKSTFGA